MQLEARLRAFAALARRGSFSAAAEELVISQPAVSKHVAELEAELGTQLVIRGSRRIRLTPAGEFVADRVELDVQIGTSEPIVELVRAHRAELAIVGGFTAARDLESETLVEDDIAIVAAPPIARSRPSLRDLERLTWISREEGSSTRAAGEAAWRDLGIAPTGRISLPSWEAVNLVVAKGAGVSGISRYAVATELAAGTLAIVRVRVWRVRRHFSLVHARDIPLSPPAERFHSILLSELAKLSNAAFGRRSRREPSETEVRRAGARRGRVR